MRGKKARAQRRELQAIVRAEYLRRKAEAVEEGEGTVAIPPLDAFVVNRRGFAKWLRRRSLSPQSVRFDEERERARVSRQKSRRRDVAEGLAA